MGRADQPPSGFNRYSYLYAKSLLDGTISDQLVEESKNRKLSTAALEKRMRLEEESLAVNEDVRNLHAAYGTNMLQLTVIQSYLKRMMDTEKIASYLQKFHPEIHEKFSEIIEINFLQLKADR